MQPLNWSFPSVKVPAVSGMGLALVCSWPLSLSSMSSWTLLWKNHHSIYCQQFLCVASIYLVVWNLFIYMYRCHINICKCIITASFIPSIFSGCSQVMPLAITVFCVRLPHLVVEGENQVAIIQCKIDAISLEKRNARFFFFTQIWASLKSDLKRCNYQRSDCKMNVRTDLLLVLQNETLILCALESERDGNIVGKAKICERRWQRAPQAELGFTSNLEKGYGQYAFAH